MFYKPVIHNWDREVDMIYKGIFKAKIIIRAGCHRPASALVMDQ